MEVKQDGRPLHQGAKKNVRTEKVALPNQLADRKHNAERLRDNLTRHFLVVRKGATVGPRRCAGVLLHCGANELIEVKEELTTQVWLVGRREYGWNWFALHSSR